MKKTLCTARLELRPIADSDVPFIIRHFAAPGVHHYLPEGGYPTDFVTAQTVVDLYKEEPPTCWRWVLVLKESGDAIGTCGFHKYKAAEQTAEIGYDLSDGYHGKGYMSEALRAVIPHAIETLGLREITAEIHGQNAASKVLVQRLGFCDSGARDTYIVGGEEAEHIVYHLLV